MITLALVQNVDTDGVYVVMPGSRGLLRGPYKALSTVAAGTTVLVASTDDGEQVVVGQTSAMDGVYNVLAFGAVGDGVADDTAALVAASAAAEQSGGTLFLGSGMTLRLTSQVDLRGHYAIDIRGRLLVDQTATPGVLIGYTSTGEMTSSIRIADVSHVSPSTSVPALRIQGLKSGQVEIGASDYVQLFADGDVADSTSVAYCSFTLGSVTKLHFFGQNGVAWINENTFHGGRIEQLIMEGPYGHNNNVFYHPKIEGDWSTIQLDCGNSNYFSCVRAEGGPTLTFAAGTYANVVTQAWVSNPAARLEQAFVLTDSGIGNLVATLSTERVQHVPLLSLAPGACDPVTNLQGTPELGGLSYGTFTDAGSAVTASSWRRLIDTGLIPVRRQAQSWNVDYLSLQAIQASSDSAWMRAVVVGYDSSGTRIDTQWDAAGTGLSWDATNDWWGVATSDQSLIFFAPEDPDVAYIRMLIHSGASGASFTRFGLEAIVHDGSMTNDLETVARRLRRPLDVTGSRGGNAALASLLTQLASLGLITDSTT